MRYKIFFDTRAQKELGRLAKNNQRRINKKIDQLAKDPGPRGKNFRSLKEYALYRLRVGNLRIIYSIEDRQKIVTIEKVGKRDEKTYRGLRV